MRTHCPSYCLCISLFACLDLLLATIEELLSHALCIAQPKIIEQGIARLQPPEQLTIANLLRSPLVVALRVELFQGCTLGHSVHVVVVRGRGTFQRNQAGFQITEPGQVRLAVTTKVSRCGRESGMRVKAGVRFWDRPRLETITADSLTDPRLLPVKCATRSRVRARK